MLRLYDRSRWRRRCRTGGGIASLAPPGRRPMPPYGPELVSRSGGGRSNPSGGRKRRPMPPIYAHNRETRTGGQRPKWAENLGFLPKLRAEGSHSLLITILFGNFNSRTQKKSWGKGLAFKGLWRCYPPPPLRSVGGFGKCITSNGMAAVGQLETISAVSRMSPFGGKADVPRTWLELRFLARS